ncbi:hypothetical protein [Methylobacterium nodulans]|uniref:Uncharacterized protein n=1 Tax=Methylobacterium nodulans (strain LMG 21967 / CNCM I-2342 / ORS 2060) TaxID=460265 RepID=B8IQT1_METNO|nr:hypothetical protein [Methylobacterium nodulans]ACL62376.1 hypothetical protein Mnod_7644 [Methylobacterium nodulans ORS 2060]
MDRALTELELAELSTADWEARCQRQKAVVADLKAKGLNACYAEAVLLQWKRTLTLMREHLARLREEQEAR